MNLVAISRVKNELDIIEAFVRHHSEYFDTLIVLDDGSSDGTYEVMQALQAAGLPLVLLREPSVGYEQSRYMTRLMHLAVDQFGADWVMPLDADEFVEPGHGVALAQLLDSREPALLKLAWHNFVWRCEEDEDAERNPVLRMRFRMPACPQCKVLVPARLLADGVAELAQGSHDLWRNGQVLPAELFSGVPLCHFPIRTVEQYASKIAVGYLQYSSMPDWDRCFGFHYIEAYRWLTEGLDQLARSMPAQSRRYGFAENGFEIGEPSEAPLDYRGGQLQYTGQRVSMLANILHCASAISDKLAERSRQCDIAHHALIAARALSIDTAASTSVKDARPVVADAPPSKADGTRLPDGAAERPQPFLVSQPATPKHRFQSFWSRGPLTPYEWFCLRSFIDFGHAFDLYTFDTSILVPPGVRICDAAELFGPEEVFVYEDGFGKGSPSAFANCFRYKLLARKGGWWVDTDVLCLAEDIPSFSEFFAWQEPDVIACGVLFFEAEHPLMVRCLEEALKLGRAVRWGDTGPILFTRLVGELGYRHRALPSSICYPVHHSEAADVLRPSKSACVGQRTATSLFMHLWNGTLQHIGVQKSSLPPKNSMLRQWLEQHPVDGWSGEYDEHTLEHALLMQTEVRTRAEENRRLTEALEMSVAERERLATDLARAAELARAERDELVRKAGFLESALATSTAENEWRRAETAAILTSTSWRVTAPVRAIGRWRVTLESWIGGYQP